MNLSQTFRAEVERVSVAVSDTFDLMMAKINALWNVQHTPTGGHKDITASSLTVTKGTVQDIAAGTATGNVTANGAGPHTFSGDVIAEQGTGTETGIGVLFTVNGATFLNGFPVRHGLLMGGVTSGHFLVTKAKGGAFTAGPGTRGWAIFDLANTPANGPMLEMAGDLGNYAIIDGGTGTTRITVGNSLRPMLAIYADSFIDTNGTFGAWTDVAFNAANFTASTGNWTLTSPDQVQYRWMRIGTTLYLKFRFDTTSVSATPNALRLTLPNGLTASKDGFEGNLIYNDNAAAWDGGGHVYATAGLTYIEFRRRDIVAWATAVNTTYIWGHATVEV